MYTGVILLDQLGIGQAELWDGHQACAAHPILPLHCALGSLKKFKTVDNSSW